jgi:O-6-methylguanine DNA methyltransferase
MRYLDGEPVVFTTPLRPVGLTPFTLDVLGMLQRVPYGMTRTYGDIALALGKPGAARAVGNACGRNPIAIVIPCHRIVASGGIGGFGPDIGLKRRLLVHEGIHTYQESR